MRMRTRGRTRFLFLLSALVLVWSGGGAGDVYADDSHRQPDGIASVAPAAKGRIRMGGVCIRSSQWISVGETGFRPDQTLVPGSPAREKPPASPPKDEYREPASSPGTGTPSFSETNLNRIEFPVRLSEAGMLGGFGVGRIPEGRYEPILMAAHFGLDANRFLNLPEMHRGRFTLFVEPRFTPLHEPSGDYELGIGLGIQYVYPVFRNLFFYTAVSCGPHFISVHTEQQARGFVIDSEAGGGFYLSLGSGSALNIGYRIRHLSNGGIRTPNTGINNHFLVVGYSMFLDVPEEKERNE
ncbi:MAG: hypothetical protein HPY65_13485 [Syntrophaceae bacterium]|nr:hypothetical protein [Syntrophaceae bacterium]